MSACYCDYEPATIYNPTRPKARKVHVCDECHTNIQPGDRYENVFGVWDGQANTFKTCIHCLSLRDHIQSIASCFCFAHGGLSSDIREWLDCVTLEPGVRFGINRMRVERKQAISRARAVQS